MKEIVVNLIKASLIVLMFIFSRFTTAQFVEHETIPKGSDVQCVNVADYNKDGFQDLLFVIWDSKNVIYFNEPWTSFINSDSIDFYYDGPVSSISVDINNDSMLDVISVNIFNDVLYYTNNNGSMDTAVTIYSDFDIINQNNKIVAAADLDSNGTIDIVAPHSPITMNNHGHMVLQRNLGNLQFESDTIIPDTSYSQFVLEDVDGNGYKDLLTEGGHVYYNSGNSFGSKNSVQTGMTGSIGTVTMIDMDEDNDLDILTYYSDTIKYIKNNGSGVYDEVGIIEVNVPNVKSLIAADFNNNGYTDLAISADSLVWYKNDGSGNFMYEATICSTCTSGFLHIGDFDNNGFTDLILQKLDSSTIYLNSSILGIKKDWAQIPGRMIITKNSLTFLDFEEPITAAQVFDNSGRLIMKESDAGVIGIESLPSGIYIVKVCAGNRSKVFKFVKK